MRFTEQDRCRQRGAAPELRTIECVGSVIEMRWSSQSESSSPFDARCPDTGETELFPDRSAPTGHRPRATVPLVRNAAQKDRGFVAESRYASRADSRPR